MERGGESRWRRATCYFESAREEAWAGERERARTEVRLGAVPFRSYRPSALTLSLSYIIYIWRIYDRRVYYLSTLSIRERARGRERESLKPPPRVLCTTRITCAHSCVACHTPPIPSLPYQHFSSAAGGVYGEWVCARASGCVGEWVRYICGEYSSRRRRPSPERARVGDWWCWCDIITWLSIY